MSEENQNNESSSSQSGSDSGQSQPNPQIPLRDGTTYIEKGEKGGTTRES